MLSRLLEHPLTRGLPVDDPRTTSLRREIIRSKPYLRALYREWYGRLVERLRKREHVLELGAGAGFLKEFLPQAICSEVFPTEGIDLVADARLLPFADASLDAVLLTDVLHHIPDVESFFREASRCMRTCGQVLMIEPWRSAWSTWVYTNLHPEPFVTDGDWTLPDTGPLSGANGALPWILFERDRPLFESRFPKWKIRSIEPMMPMCYLLSGGVSMRSLAPGWLYRPTRFIERLAWEKRWAMFALIELEKCA